ncbi:MAG TPA: hypothetical protein VHC20_03290 [Candidatus Paceibacterota bacterium]|nr:hypothetical protein [Candidatus Paceibacterota bacterium]
MTPALLLRLASALTLVQYTAHSALFLSATSARESSSHFGYGLIAILYGALEIVLLWQIGALARDEPRRARPMIALLTGANLIHALLVWTYFRIIPAVAFDVLVAGVLVAALFATRRRSSDGGVA